MNFPAPPQLQFCNNIDIIIEFLLRIIIMWRPWGSPIPTLNKFESSLERLRMVNIFFFISISFYFPNFFILIIWNFLSYDPYTL